MHIVLAGGVGGSKLVFGLTRILGPQDLLVVVNTGDDFTHLGLRICPDLDTVMYTLAGMANAETGWGVRGETWNFMTRVEQDGGPAWFRIGDRDLETHRARTSALESGLSLTDITVRLSRNLGVRHRIVPATDDEVRTVVLSGQRRIPFQDYFVRLACRPAVSGFEFKGANEAMPAPPVMDAVNAGAVESLIIGPSNPFVSIGPILAIPGFRRILEERAFRAVAVSPIIGGRAIKGPAAKMMKELGLPVTSRSVAEHYGPLIDGLILDETDRDQAADIRALGLDVLVARTLMRSDEDRIRLARQALAFASRH